MEIVTRFRRAIAKIEPTQEEIEAALPGDTLIRLAPFVLNRGMDLPLSPDELSGWLLQIGKRSEGRGGWYLPRSVERWLPQKNRALRCVDPRLALKRGQQIHDWMSFGKPHLLTVEILDLEEHVLVLTGRRLGGYSWALVWREVAPGQTRLVMRMRAGRYGWVARLINKVEMLLVCYTFREGLVQRVQKG